MSTDSQGRATCDWCQSPFKPAKKMAYYSKYYKKFIPIRLCEDCEKKYERDKKGEY